MFSVYWNLLFKLHRFQGQCNDGERGKKGPQRLPWTMSCGHGDYRIGGEGEVTEHMSVSSSKVGLVIGRGGEMMRSIKDNSGALKGILSQPLSYE